MKAVCKISGVEFQIRFSATTLTKGKREDTDCFPKLALKNAIHPIFSQDVKLLVSLAHNWSNGELNEQEKKLLLLALLHSTDKLIFNTAAFPSSKTVATYMERALRFVNWFHAINDPKLVDALPELSVNKDTKYLDNLDIYFEAWDGAAAAYKDRYKQVTINERIKVQEDLLSRLIASPLGKQDRKLRLLANWAIEAAGVAEKDRERFIKIFTMTDAMDIYNTPQVQIESMVEFLQLHLANTYSTYKLRYTLEVMKQVNDLLDARRKGLSNVLGIPGITIIEEDNEVTTHNKQRAATLAPSASPNLAAYKAAGKSMATWIRDHAAWMLAQSKKEKEVSIAHEMELRKVATEKQEDLDNIMAREEMELARDDAQLELRGIINGLAGEE